MKPVKKKIGLFKRLGRKSRERADPLQKAKSRDEIIKRLEGMGYLIRRKRIRKPKVGDTVRFRVGGDWSINTWYYRTAKVVEFPTDDPEKPFEKYGYMRVEKHNDKGVLVHAGVVHPLEVVKVTRHKPPKTLLEESEIGNE